MMASWISVGQSKPTGPFYGGTERTNHMHPKESLVEEGLLFSASRNNNVFGNSSTIQPASIRLLPCIKA